MSSVRTIGVLGASGGVGSAAALQISDWKLGPLRLAARDGERVRRLSTGLSDCEVVSFDIHDERALQRFCAGCAVVINGAGPSSEFSERVARAALASGADCIDPAGNDDLLGRISDLDPRGRGRRALIGAGMVPGLSALLPRCVALDSSRALSLRVYVGGRDRFTRAAAMDYLMSLRAGEGESMAAWRHGRRVSKALSPLRNARLPFFAAPVTAHPYWSEESDRVARALELEEGAFYNVFDGEQTELVLGGAWKAALGGSDAQFVADLIRAGDLDLCGRSAYQQLIFSFEGRTREARIRRTLVLRGTHANGLSAAMVALATRAVLEGRAPTGAHHAGEALCARSALAELAQARSVQRLAILPHEDESDAGELSEGVV